jgi:hypothetical protein
MDSFSYLSVLISIILGLGVAHLLGGFAELIKRRSSLKLWWPIPLWMITTFLIHVQTWWALFALRAVEHWSFAAFLIVLLQPVSLFMMASLITPRFSGDAPHDLEQLYWREHRWFFAFILAALAASLGKDLILTGHFPEPANLAAHGLFAVVAALAILMRSRRLHTLLASVGLLLLCGYIAVLFTALPHDH